MVEPVIVPRADHPISRRDIDSEALKVLYRLNQSGHVAYLVGGSVRDLILGRRPKDFDIGTSAHPYEIKKLFRNCWIIGRRFRLAHIKFGVKTIEVATFRKNIPDPPPDAPETPVVVASSPDPASEADARDGMIKRDNTFGTPEEDAFRRDFTINGLFYDISTYSVIDYVGGLGDLQRRVIRSIGDPNVRFVEDPVRMLRAAVLAARLGFDMDPLVHEAIATHRGLITKASPARLLEEYYKILRSGCAEASFRALGRSRLLELITPELASPPDAVWDALARLDAYRQRFPSAPPELTNTMLVGSLLVPLGALQRRQPGAPPPDAPERVSFGVLPVARRDIDRLSQLLTILPRMLDPELPPRLAKSLPHRPAFPDALLWLEMFGESPDALDHWKQAREARAPRAPGADAGGPRSPGPPSPGAEGDAVPGAARRRRRRRRGRRGRGRVEPKAE